MARYNGPVIDVDIHHKWKNAADIYSYLPARWREYAEAGGAWGMRGRPPAVTTATLYENAARLATSFPADGSPPASDYELLREQLLGKYRYTRGPLRHDLCEYG